MSLILRKFILVAIALFHGVVGAAITPSFKTENDEICGLYYENYAMQLSSRVLPSFLTNEIIVHEDNSVYKPTENGVIPIEFSKPLSNPLVNWLKWFPETGLSHSFMWGGAASDVIAVANSRPNSKDIFVLKVFTIGWRGPFYQIWLVDEEEFASITRKNAAKVETINLEKTTAKQIYPINDVNHQPFTNLIEFKNNFYILTPNRVFKLTSDTFKPVCEMGLTNAQPQTQTQITALENAANQSLMTKGVTHIPMYYGTMGNRHKYVENGFKNAFERPWLIQTEKDGSCYQGAQHNLCGLNKSVDAIISQIASLDPWSYREMFALQEHMIAAKSQLQHYYIKQLDIESKVASGMANQAIYDFLAKTVYLHSYLTQQNFATTRIEDPYTLDDSDAKLKNNWFNKTALMWAAHFNDYDAVENLLKNVSNVNEVTKVSDSYSSLQFLNRTALTYALENATLPTIQLLLRAGADISVRDSQGNDLQYYLEKNNSLNYDLHTLTTLPLQKISPSFNCHSAKSKYEKATCSSKGLAVYDAQLAALYIKVKAQNKSTDIKSSQRDWLKRIRRECNFDDQTSVVVCMKKRYRARIKYLANLNETLEQS